MALPWRYPLGLSMTSTRNQPRRIGLAGCADALARPIERASFFGIVADQTITPSTTLGPSKLSGDGVDEGPRPFPIGWQQRS